MKRYGLLFDRITSIDNLIMAHQNAKKGKEWYKEVRDVEKDVQSHILHLQTQLRQGTYSTGEYDVFTRQCGSKLREISRLPYFPDRVVHHAILQVIGDIWVRSLVSDTYACIKGRGIHKAAKKLKGILRQYPDLYCLKVDIRKFYPSIDHDILKSIVRHKIKCYRTIELLDGIIDSTDSGIPIGNYLSQHFANIYMSRFDHWIKETKRIKHYFRYSDDMIFLHKDKRRLHILRSEIAEYLRDKLRLDLKSNWQVFPVKSRGIDFLGYRFFPGYTLVRKSISARFKKQAMLIRERRITGHKAISSIMSYYGWLKPANSLNLIKRHVDIGVKAAIRAASAELGVRNPLIKRLK